MGSGRRSPVAIEASGWIAPATSQAAAEERSPGTTRSRAANPTGPSIVVSVPTRTTGAPSQPSMRSVWSRVGPGTEMRVRPAAASDASVMHPSTWALATGSRWSSARGDDVPPIRSGACPSVVSTEAPIARSGPAIRSIGRREREASPTSTAVAGRPASAPERSRIVVPELPQSSSSSPSPGSRACSTDPPPSSPTRTRPSAASRTSVTAPSRSTAPSVERTSAPGRSSVTTDRPAAIAPTISARCATDLSDGSRSLPRSELARVTARAAPTSGARVTASGRSPRRGIRPRSPPLPRHSAAAPLATRAGWRRRPPRARRASGRRRPMRRPRAR